ncbi:hypothetical protein GWG65_36100 [Bradyrhizobium sp. CSA207]|uniref:hypothetical protein n=1 Tax=Bradyrhizobium sp. CSA207 TaxID=2698826 RepID=UPI0023AFFD83|nr:hypothetical protein [Bradyrhizobium sp. CSA207]MDE5446689.1 hypothetical protein [Bradyrhizobium sp. CSA207]
MLEIEISGSKMAIDPAKAELGGLLQDVRQFQHRGFAGEAGLIGLIGKIVPTALPGLFTLLKSLLVKDRDLKVSVNGNEFVVRDVPELQTLLDMLSARGVVIQKEQK